MSTKTLGTPFLLLRTYLLFERHFLFRSPRCLRLSDLCRGVKKDGENCIFLLLLLLLRRQIIVIEGGLLTPAKQARAEA